MKNEQKTKLSKIFLRKQRTRKKILGKEKYPRLTVFRSLKHFYLQIIDDAKGITLCAASDKNVKVTGKKPIEIAAEVGKELAKRAIAKKIDRVIFDRGANKYHGRVKAAAEGAREGGLKF